MITYDDWIQLNETVVKHFTNVFDIAYHKTETELQKLFAETPSEMNIRNRVKRLNAVYGTRISEPDQVKIAAFIKKENIVGLALSGDYDAVEKLALDENRGFNRCLSFASKFCSFCNPDVYPIYDSLVLEALLGLNRIKTFDYSYDEKEKNRIKNEFDYSRFRRLIEKFRNHDSFGIASCSLREIDKFLWITGKGLGE